MTSLIEETDTDIVVIEDDEPELTCEYRNRDKSRCSRAAYVTAQLNKPCGHFNAGFLICKPHWEMVLAITPSDPGFTTLVCGRCGQPFNIKACIVSWDLI